MKTAAMTLSRAALVAMGVAMAGAGSAQAQELGRLFFTPEQRSALDARRKARVPDKPAAAAVADSPVSRVNGAVQRGGGKSTVWVNGEMIPENPQADSARLLPQGSSPGRVSIPAGEGPRRHDLRVGDALDRNSGEVRDVIGEGEIKIGRRPAAPKK